MGGSSSSFFLFKSIYIYIYFIIFSSVSVFFILFDFFYSSYLPYMYNIYIYIYLPYFCHIPLGYRRISLFQNYQGLLIPHLAGVQMPFEKTPKQRSSPILQKCVFWGDGGKIIDYRFPSFLLLPSWNVESLFVSRHKKIKTNSGFREKNSIHNNNLGIHNKTFQHFSSFSVVFFFLSPLSTTPHGEAELEQALEAFNLLKVDPLFDV